MGLLRRLRDAFAPPSVPMGDPQADLALVRRGLEAEAKRLGRRSRLSLSLLMEYSAADLTTVDVHAALGYLDARGEIVNVQEDSFGNLRFDLADPASAHPPE